MPLDYLDFVPAVLLMFRQDVTLPPRRGMWVLDRPKKLSLSFDFEIGFTYQNEVEAFEKDKRVGSAF